MCLDWKSKPRAPKCPGCRSSCSQGIARSWTSHRNIAKGKCQQKVQPSSTLGQVKLISTSTTECRRGAHLLSHCCINGHVVPGHLLQPLQPVLLAVFAGARSSLPNMQYPLSLEAHTPLLHAVWYLHSAKVINKVHYCVLISRAALTDKSSHKRYKCNHTLQ